MATAGIVPQTTQVRSGDAELTRITGAQAPSGIPVTITSPVAERAPRAAASSRGRRSRAGQERRAGGTGQSRAVRGTGQRRPGAEAAA